VFGAWVLLIPGPGKVGVTARVGVLSAEELAPPQLVKNSARSNNPEKMVFLDMLTNQNEVMPIECNSDDRFLK
jgi:hypothetical protein